MKATYIKPKFDLLDFRDLYNQLYFTNDFNLTPQAKAIIMLVATYASKDGDWYGSTRGIMQECKIKSERRVQQYLKQLKEEGFITKGRVNKKGKVCLDLNFILVNHKIEFFNRANTDSQTEQNCSLETEQKRSPLTISNNNGSNRIEKKENCESENELLEAVNTLETWFRKGLKFDDKKIQDFKDHISECSDKTPFILTAKRINDIKHTINNDEQYYAALLASVLLFFNSERKTLYKLLSLKDTFNPKDIVILCETMKREGYNEFDLKEELSSMENCMKTVTDYSGVVPALVQFIRTGKKLKLKKTY